MPIDYYRTHTKPKAASKRSQLTAISYEILGYIVTYRFNTTSMLRALVDACLDTIQEQTAFLYKLGLSNFFKDPVTCEYTHYADNKATLDLLRKQHILIPSKQMYQEIRTNKRKNYAQALLNRKYGSLMFIDHEMQTGQLRFMAELTSRNSGNTIDLLPFRKGSMLWQSIPDLKLAFDPSSRRFYKIKEQIYLPVQPDGLMSLRFNNYPEASNTFHFLIEIENSPERATLALLDKFRAIYRFIKSGQYKAAYGLSEPIRAVLIVCVDEAHQARLMRLVCDPNVSDGRKPGLFWFTTRDNLNAYLTRPASILDPIWSSPADRYLHSMADLENRPAKIPNPSPIIQTQPVFDFDPIEDI